MSETDMNLDIDLDSAEGAGMDTQVSYPRPNPKPMPRWEVTEDIVISGIAGRFPESDNMDEYAHNLFSNVDMVTADDRRWPIGKSVKVFAKMKSKSKLRKIMIRTKRWFGSAYGQN